jgi:hypothetical protein
MGSGPFFGFNRQGAKVSQGLIDSFWAQGMQASHKSTYSTPTCCHSSSPEPAAGGGCVPIGSQ